MDFNLTPAQQQLKAEFETFFKEEAKRAPVGWMSDEDIYVSDEGWAYHRSVADKLAKKGWISLAWPKEYGGQELGYVEQLLFQEVKGYYKVPGVDMHYHQIAACLLNHGSEAMRKEWLPRMARAEINWAEGYSEPDAGSDLASVTTRAVEDGDCYVINGQKTWTSGAHRCNYIFVLARTDPKATPKHKGLTFFLSELDRPGISMRPVYYMNGAHVFNEVFFDNVRIPKSMILGQVNKGWYVTMGGRNFARVRIEAVAMARRDLEHLVEFCRETKGYDGQPLAKDPLVRQKLADVAIELEGARLAAYNVAWTQSKGLDPLAEPSANKYFNTEAIVRFAHSALEIMGLRGTILEGSKWTPLHGNFAHLVQFGLGPTIGGGTSDVQKNIIAWRGLNLPREKD